MRYTFDTAARTLTIEDGAAEHRRELFSAASFEALTGLWVKVGWALRYTYQFTWLGRPIIQLPQDVLRYQELIWRLRPDVIIETGVAHGGSLLLSASLCRLMGKGRVIGIDLEIRAQNREAIEADALADCITLIEGSSIDPAVVSRVRELVPSGATVLVLLDSDHTKSHVRAELEAYAPLVTRGSYVIAADGVIRDLAKAPGAGKDWEANNPVDAVEEFLVVHPEFRQEVPGPVFRESRTTVDATYWTDGYLKRLS